MFLPKLVKQYRIMIALITRKTRNQCVDFIPVGLASNDLNIILVESRL